jgi:hypothetical protein
MVVLRRAAVRIADMMRDEQTIIPARSPNPLFNMRLSEQSISLAFTDLRWQSGASGCA